MPLGFSRILLCSSAIGVLLSSPAISLQSQFDSAHAQDQNPSAIHYAQVNPARKGMGYPRGQPYPTGVSPDYFEGHRQLNSGEWRQTNPEQASEYLERGRQTNPTARTSDYSERKWLSNQAGPSPDYLEGRAPDYLGERLPDYSEVRPLTNPVTPGR